MPGPIDAAFLASLPAPIQWIVTGLAGTAIAVMVIANYVRSFRKGPEPEVKKDLVLQTASFADMTPVRDVAKHLKTMADEARLQRLATEGILEVLTEKEKDDDFAKAVDLKVREALLAVRETDRPPPRR